MFRLGYGVGIGKVENIRQYIHELWMAHWKVNIFIQGWYCGFKLLEYRIICHLSINNFHRLGIAGVAALGRDWKSMLTWISAVHIITPLLMNFVPESSRWLLASERLERRQEAKSTMKDAAIANGIYTQDTDTKIDALVHKNVSSTQSKSKAGFLVIFR